MITDIAQTHEIFSSDEYLKDIVPFGLMELIKQRPMLLKSNEKDFIIGMTSPEMPIWVWTSDHIEPDSLTQLCEYFYDRFQDGQSVCYVAKPEVATLLAGPFIKQKSAQEHRVELQSFENPKIIPAQNRDVAVERPTTEDVNDLAICMVNFEKDCFHRIASPSSLLKKAKSKLDDPNFFVIKQNCRVAAMAQSSRETDTHISINQVYTKPEYRGRGFAAALVAYLSEMIVKKGKIPTLYTDISNPSSNKAYKNVGFIEKGRVDEVTLTWDKSLDSHEDSKSL